jgi:hypothetical protein
MRRSDRIAWWTLGIGIIVIFGGLGVFGMLTDPPQPFPAPVDKFCPPQPVGTARGDTDFKETADPYRGKGPHPVKLQFVDIISGEDAGELPSRWQAGDAGEKPKAQLVACGYQDRAGTRETRVCEYVPEYTANMYWQLPGHTRPENIIKIPLLKASYVFEIYEAKTAKPLGRFTVPGDQACPGSVKRDNRTFIGQAPDAAKLRKVLRPYAERTVS